MTPRQIRNAANTPHPTGTVVGRTRDGKTVYVRQADGRIVAVRRGA